MAYELERRRRATKHSKTPDTAWARKIICRKRAGVNFQAI